MKVLQINTVCGTGSTGRIATDIHRILIDEDHESYIAYGRELPKNCNNAIRIGSKVDNYTHALKTRIFDKHGFGSVQATYRFIEKVREIDPDIVHLHNIHGYYINIEILFNYLKETNKPVVWTLHDCWSFTGHCAYFDYAGCEKWKSGCYSCPEKKSYPSSFVFDNSKKNYLNKREVLTGLSNMKLITPSTWLADLVKESYLKEYSVNVINNGIDLNVFKPTVNKFRVNNNLEGKFIILGVANDWSRRKGLKFLLDLANRLSEDEILVLVGLSNEQLTQIPKGVLGFSRTNNVTELVDIYSSADVYVNPTLEDNFPTTNIEALACGTPVITFETGGSPESIQRNIGTVVKIKSSDNLYEAIKKYRISSEDFSAECVNRAKAFYDKNDRYIDYIKIYEEMVNKQ